MGQLDTIVLLRLLKKERADLGASRAGHTPRPKGEEDKKALFKDNVNGGWPDVDSKRRAITTWGKCADKTRLLSIT